MSSGVAVLRSTAAASSDGVLRRDAEQHRDVAELEVGVDQRDRRRRSASRARPRRWSAIVRLADATLGREHDDQATGRRAARRRGAGSARGARRVRRAARRPGRPTGAGSPRRRSTHRVACAGPQRLLEQLGRQLVDREHRAELRVRAGEPVHLLEARRARRDPGRTPRRSVAPRRRSATSSSIVSNCAAPASSIAEPHPDAAASGSTTATSIARRPVSARPPATRRRRRRPPRLPAAASLPRPIAARRRRGAGT